MRKMIAALLTGAMLSVFAIGSASASEFLADRHAARGVKCAACHTTSAPKAGAAVDMAKCTACHGSLDQVAKKTKAKGLDPDPHYNHLVGLDCNECHKGHKASVNMCGTCHNLKFKVP